MLARQLINKPIIVYFILILFSTALLSFCKQEIKRPKEPYSKNHKIISLGKANVAKLPAFYQSFGDVIDVQAGELDRIINRRLTEVAESFAQHLNVATPHEEKVILIHRESPITEFLGKDWKIMFLADRRINDKKLILNLPEIIVEPYFTKVGKKSLQLIRNMPEVGKNYSKKEFTTGLMQHSFMLKNADTYSPNTGSTKGLGVIINHLLNQSGGKLLLLPEVKLGYYQRKILHKGEGEP